MVLELLHKEGKPIRTITIQDRLGLSYSVVYSRLKELCKNGLVIRFIGERGRPHFKAADADDDPHDRMMDAIRVDDPGDGPESEG
jgi:predicted transcriptional regulator